MSEAEINIAIAEVRGWTDIQTHDGFTTGHKPGEADPSEWRRWHLPNYTGDLNAMHEAEKMLSQKQIADYVFELHLHVPDADLTAYAGRMGEAAPYFFPAIHATARQRAEAFLRTIGKWKEGV